MQASNWAQLVWGAGDPRYTNRMPDSMACHKASPAWLAAMPKGGCCSSGSALHCRRLRSNFCSPPYLLESMDSKPTSNPPPHLQREHLEGDLQFLPQWILAAEHAVCHPLHMCTLRSCLSPEPAAVLLATPLATHRCTIPRYMGLWYDSYSLNQSTGVRRWWTHCRTSSPHQGLGIWLTSASPCRPQKASELITQQRTLAGGADHSVHTRRRHPSCAPAG